MKFTQDWFSHNISNFELIRKILPERKRFLEIGSFEGRATVWMLQNMLDADGHITCIDTFKGSEEHTILNLNSLEAIFRQNVSEAKNTDQVVEVLSMTSYDGLGYLIAQKEQYDFIYIDGSHTAFDVMTDACMAFGLLKKGGIMLFDDYLWRDMPGVLHRPKLGIDLFLMLFDEKVEIRLLGYQLGIVKL